MITKLYDVAWSIRIFYMRADVTLPTDKESGIKQFLVLFIYTYSSISNIVILNKQYARIYYFSTIIILFSKKYLNVNFQSMTIMLWFIARNNALVVRLRETLYKYFFYFIIISIYFSHNFSLLFW